VLSRGQWAGARRGVGGVDGLLGGQPAGLVDAAQVLLDELIHPEKCWHKVRFDTLACSVSHSTPVGADSVPVKQDCRGGLYPSACSAPAATIRLGRGHRCFPRF
jgi:hypothetical protein